MMPSSLVSFSNELASVVEQSALAVVAVHARPRFNSSGVHWSSGLVVTAEHRMSRRRGQANPPEVRPTDDE